MCALAPLWQRISQAVELFIVVDLLFQVVQGNAERAGAVYVAEEKVWGDHTSGYRYLIGGVKEREPDSWQQCCVKTVGMLICKKFH